jgi:multiple sugar transport system substrate-binding protein
VAAVAVTTLAFGLTACSGADETDDAAPDAIDDEEVSEPAGPLSVWVMGDVGGTFEEVTADFTAETGIEVQVDAIPWENVNDKLTTAIASGEGPDVIQVGLSLLSTFADADALLDLGDQVADHPGIAPASFPDAVAPENLGDGRMLTIPWISDTRVLFYRSDILAEAGYDAPPTTWEEMRETAAALAERGDGQYGYYIPLWDNTLPVQYTWQAGGDVIGADGAVDFDTPEFDAAVDHWLGFFADGAAPTASDWDQAQGFVSGATPMVISGPYLAGAIREAAPELDGSWGVALSPSDENGTSLFAGSNLGIWHSSENVDAAVLLLEYMADAETQIAWYDAVGELPTSLAALDELGGRGDELLAVYAEQLTQARTVPMVPGWDLIANEMVTALTAIAATGADRDSTLTAFFAKADEIAANY